MSRPDIPVTISGDPKGFEFRACPGAGTLEVDGN